MPGSIARDTFAVDLLEHGTPLEEVSKALGHESIKQRRNTTPNGCKAGPFGCAGDGNVGTEAQSGLAQMRAPSMPWRLCAGAFLLGIGDTVFDTIVRGYFVSDCNFS